MPNPAPSKPGAASRNGTSSKDLTYVQLVVDRARHAQNQYQSYFRRITRWYDLYRGIYSGRFQQFRNNVHIPFTLSVIQSDVARKVQATFGVWPIVSFAGYSTEDAAIARKVETLISAQMKDAKSFHKAYDLFLSGNLYGNGIARYSWRKDERFERWREVDDHFDIEVVREGNVVRFDGPDWDVIDPLDFWLQPGQRRIQDAAWAIHRYYLDIDQIEQMVKQGVFKRDAYDQLKQAPMNQTQTSELGERMSVYRNASDWEARRTEKHARPVEIWEMWGEVPSDNALDGVTNVVLTVANRRVLLRGRENPYWHGQIPFLNYCPNPDLHYFHGIGKAEIAEKLQITANRLANQKLDALDLFIDPVFLANRQSGIDTQNLIMRAGRVIGVDGPVDDSQVRALIPDLRGLQQAYAEIGQLSGWIQAGTGIIEDTVAGLPSSGRQTAREYLGRQEAGLSRVMMEARLAEEDFVEELANGFRMLDRQHLDTPHELKILGSTATINPITGLPMPQEPMVIDIGDLNQDYRARAMGASQTMGKAVRQQNLIAVLQAFTSNPALLSAVNWSAMATEILRTFDFLNPQEFLNSQQTNLNEQAMAQGSPAAGATGAGTDRLPALNPEIIAQMMGQGQAPIPGV